VKPPEATVVVPTRDRWALLARHALPSALGQEAIDVEVIVVDDGSTDDTQHGLRQVDDPRLRVLRNDVARRLPAARNAGAGAARGEWLAFLDDDDVWSPRKLREQIDAARATGRTWAYGRAVVVDASLRVLESDPFPAPERLGELLLGGNWIPGGGSNVVVRADAFRRSGGFDEELRFFEDWDLWLRLLREGLPAALDEVVVARVEHGANMVVRDRGEVARAHELLLGKHRPVTAADRRSVAEWLAFEQHRAGRRFTSSLLYLTTAVSHRSPGNLLAAGAALFGKRGMRTASWLLAKLRGASHLPVERGPAPLAPSWLRPDHR
jgi:glycosyltransferase involved in cell wall biosynthesis